MPQNKDHHFVPQFYLRHFSADQRSIALFSVKNSRSVLTASIRGQCQRAYFYGRDGETETAFAKMEGSTAQILKSIVRTQRPPPPRRENHISLMFHVVSQHARTANAANEQNEYSDQFAKSLIRPTLPRDGLTCEDLDHVQIVLSDPVAEALRLIAPAFPLTLDLRCVVLVNESRVGLITSDNPVVLYNQFLEERRDVSNTGLQSVGLQIYLPLAPHIGCFFYDPAIYGVGSKNPNRIVLEHDSVVAQLNTLQLLSAVENVYFHPGTNDPSALSTLYSSVKRFRRKKRMNFVSQDAMPIKKDESRRLYAVFREDIRCEFDPSFLKILKRAKRKRSELLDRAAIRNPRQCEAYDQYREKIRTGTAGNDEFTRFLNKASASI